MNTYSTAPVLPTKFKMVERVRSVEFKNKLIATIDSIHRQMNNHSILEPSAKTKRLVDGFFNYLTASCTDPQIINTRAIWLAKYATVIEHHLVIQYQELIKNDVPVVEDTHLIDKLAQLTDVIAQYRTSLDHRCCVDDVVHSTLSQLIEFSGSIIPAQDVTRYQVIVQEIDMVTNSIKQFHHNGAVTDEQRAPWIVLALSDIRSMMVQYIVQQKALS